MHPRNHQWSPCKWSIDGATDRLQEVFIERVAGRPGTPDRFAIRRTGYCMNIEGEWEIEPTPSNRDEDFLKRCRFATFDDAAMCHQYYNPAK